MADNKELAVVHVMPRKSGSTTYILNTPKRNTVFHSKKGPMTCMDPTCAACDDPRDPTRHKGCEHTRCARRYYELHGDERDEQPALAGTDAEAGADVLDDYA